MSDRMNPEVKAAWVLNLRSGEFAQGRNALKTESGRYCCLGVLCEQAYREGKTEHWEAENADSDAFYGDEQAHFQDPDDEYGSWATLPNNVQEWAALKERDPFVRVPTDHPRYEHTSLTPVEWDETTRTYLHKGARLSQLNDEGWTFEEIADLIEDQF